MLELVFPLTKQKSKSRVRTRGLAYLSLSIPKPIHLTEQLESAIRAFTKKYFHSKGNSQAFDALKW